MLLELVLLLVVMVSAQEASEKQRALVADSKATLMAPVDGISGSLSSNVMAQFVHIACLSCGRLCTWSV